MTDDMRLLMDQKPFRAFLLRLIQSSGILQPTNGVAGRDLNWIEGRKALGFWVLSEAEKALPPELRSPECARSLMAILNEIPNPKPTKKDDDDD
jgi:hypothetical protein